MARERKTMVMVIGKHNAAWWIFIGWWWFVLKVFHYSLWASLLGFRKLKIVKEQ
jgi:hypothetical protein